jgi:hypothetical protein
VKGRMRKIGRDPDGMKILPGAFVVVGDSVEEAREKRAKLDSLVHYDSGIASLNGALGYDVSGFDPDGPLPEIPPTNASQSARDRIVAAARKDNLTIHQLAQRSGSYAGLAFVGTPRTINVPLPARGPGRLHRPGRAGTPTPWPVPHRVRGRDTAGKPGLGAACQPVFRGIGPGQTRRRGGIVTYRAMAAQYPTCPI